MRNENEVVHCLWQALLSEIDAGKMALTRLLERFSRTDEYRVRKRAAV
jgi:hypothetical protein